MSDIVGGVLGWVRATDARLSRASLNAMGAEVSAVSVYPSGDVETLRRYIDGTELHRFGFVCEVRLAWSRGYDSTNQDAAGYVSEMCEALRSRLSRGDFPKFGGNAVATGGTVEPMAPALVVVEDGGAACYSFAFRIDVRQKG